MSAFSMIISQPLGYIISFIYNLVQNYGFTIIIFTIIVKLLMLPLTIKQQKSTVQMQKIQPEIQAIQKKYANDQQRLSQETMKVYKKYNVSPMGGCLPLLIQLPIIFGLFDVIKSPMTYILHMSPEKIEAVKGLVGNTTGNQIEIANAMTQNLATIQEKLGEVVSGIQFDFFGLDLSATPNFGQLSALWLIPALSALTSYLTGVITAKLSGNEQSQQQMKTMNIMMPLMSGYFCFIMPAGVGLYWVTSSVVQIVQQIVITSALKSKEKRKENI